MLNEELKKAVVDGLEELNDDDMEEVAGGITNIKHIGSGSNSDSQKSSSQKARVSSKVAKAKKVDAVKGSAKGALRSDLASKAASLMKGGRGNTKADVNDK